MEKFVQKEDKKVESDQSYESEEENEVETPQEKFIIERNYFKVKEGKEEEKSAKVYDVEYLLSFKDWKICQENKLLDNMLIDHIESMENYMIEERPGKQKGGKNQKDENKKTK